MEPLETRGENVPDELQGRERFRVWGATDGEKKRTSFDRMESGDLVFFHRDGNFFAAARADKKFTGSHIGDWIWNNPESRLVYTLSDYTEIDVPKEELWDILGYKSGNRLQSSLVRISDEARSNLLQKYSSIENAYSDLKGEGTDEEGDYIEIDENNETEVREHVKIQWYLIQLGLLHNHDVYVAINDQNTEYQGEKLGKNCIEQLSIAGFSQAALDVIKYVDVIWLNGDYIVQMFEVESTTSIYSGILRMTDFVVQVPNLGVDMNIVAPGGDENLVRKQMNRPTFRRIVEPSRHCSLRYISFEEVRERYDLVQRAGPLQTVF